MGLSTETSVIKTAVYKKNIYNWSVFLQKRRWKKHQRVLYLWEDQPGQMTDHMGLKHYCEQAFRSVEKNVSQLPSFDHDELRVG